MKQLGLDFGNGELVGVARRRLFSNEASQMWRERLNSREFQELRSRVFARAAGRCENPDCRHVCTGTGRDVLHVHHIQYLEKDCESNLLALCPTCHLEWHRIVDLIVRRWLSARSFPAA